jgi:hypothetical protein
MLRNIALLITTLLTASIVLGAAPQPAAERSHQEDERESLRGLHGVGLLVEPLDSDIEQLGLSTDTIEQDVRQRLEKGGVKVLTDRERLATPMAAVLIIRVDTLHDRIGRYFYSTDLLLTQRVKLATHGAPEVAAVTWKKLGVVSAIADDNLKHLGDQVLRKVDQFVKDYRAVNPDKRKP